VFRQFTLLFAHELPRLKFFKFSHFGICVATSDGVQADVHRNRFLLANIIQFRKWILKVFIIIGTSTSGLTAATHAQRLLIYSEALLAPLGAPRLG